jgi:hypothetical protein
MAVTSDLRTVFMNVIRAKFRIPISFNIVTRPKATEHFHAATQSANYYRSKQFILGVFAKLRKMTISFVMCACRSIRMEKLDSQWTEVQEML